MNKQVIMTNQPSSRWLFVGALAASLTFAFGDKVTLDQLPRSARRAIQAQAGSASIEDIDREIKNGRTFYDVAFKKDGRNVELRVADDGTLVNSEGVAETKKSKIADEPLSGARKTTMAELPKMVRDVIQAQSAGAPIEDIETGTVNGQTAYEAAFKRNGEHVELRVAEDGTVLNQSDAVLARDLSRLPVAVREAIQAHVGSSKITDLYVDRQRAKPAYEVEFQRDGQRRHIAFAQDGTVIRGDEAVGSAGAASVIGKGASSSTKLTLDQLPAAAQSSIRAQLGRTPIEEIHRKVTDKQVAYEVAFKRGGESKEIEVSDDGTLLKTKTVTYSTEIIGRPAR
jgi:uncharacterized membrane protein YkoI